MSDSLKKENKCCSDCDCGCDCCDDECCCCDDEECCCNEDKEETSSSCHCHHEH